MSAANIYDALFRLEEEHTDARGVFPELSTSRYVPGEGNATNCQAFIVGEAPGAQEDAASRPFVGPAGSVLRQLMELAGFSFAAENYWLTNVIKFRPPRNRNPTETEIRAFRPLLLTEWKIVGSPQLIIPIGGIALRAIVGRSISILRAAGKCHTYTTRMGREISIWPMVHPSFGLRNPAAQPLLEQDWENLAAWRRIQSG